MNLKKFNKFHNNKNNYENVYFHTGMIIKGRL